MHKKDELWSHARKNTLNSSMSTSSSLDSHEGSQTSNDRESVDVTISPLPVRNTFVDFPIGRPPSLDGFFQERQVKSAPASGIDADVQDAVAIEPTVDPNNEALDGGWSYSWHPSSGSTSVACSAAATSSPVATSSRPTSISLAAALALDTLVTRQNAVPELGAPDLPSLGSAFHSIGDCKPCAFVWRPEGCSTGMDCQFCHLCDKGEKKQRAKEKRRVVRMRQAMSRGLTLSMSLIS